jgi:hypothetical protein
MQQSLDVVTRKADELQKRYQTSSGKFRMGNPRKRNAMFEARTRESGIAGGKKVGVVSFRSCVAQATADGK